MHSGRNNSSGRGQFPGGGERMYQGASDNNGDQQNQGGRGRGNNGDQPNPAGGAPPRPPYPGFQHQPALAAWPPQAGFIRPSTPPPPPPPPRAVVQFLPQPPRQPSASRPADDLTMTAVQIPGENAKEVKIHIAVRPDRGGEASIARIGLLVNHFYVAFDPGRLIYHYDVDVRPQNYNRLAKVALRKSGAHFIKDKLFSENDWLKTAARLTTAYDGAKNMFSAVRLLTGSYRVDVPRGEDVKSGSYTFTITFVKVLKLSDVIEYFMGTLPYIPRGILQGMDLVLKDNPRRKRIRVGRRFYSMKGAGELSHALEAYKGFEQSLKKTSEGLALCLDYSVAAFRKPFDIFYFLMQHIRFIEPEARAYSKYRAAILYFLKGLKVRVTHRPTKRQYTIHGFSNLAANDLTFEVDDPQGINPPQMINLITYYKDKWGVDVRYADLPCLQLGTFRSNLVPFEFCELVEGQRFPEKHLVMDDVPKLKNMSLATPWDRRETIYKMMQSDDGPCGDVSENFGITVSKNMTEVVGRVIDAPELRLGASQSIKVEAGLGQWDIVGKTLVDGKSVDRWVLLNFSCLDKDHKLQVDPFIKNLRGCCRSLGIQMDEPILRWGDTMDTLSLLFFDKLRELLKNVLEDFGSENKGTPQMIICVLSDRHSGYKYLKWLCEVELGVLTQCCLSYHANNARKEYLTNLCLKINAKLGGSNFELLRNFPFFGAEDRVMFIGADVNHPEVDKSSCPSIAAVVGTSNWPAANRYIARFRPQAHRSEVIVKFGDMCLDLVNTYEKLNGVKPNRIVIFRDGVGEGQFETVLSTEYCDLKKSFRGVDYQPRITVVVAQKRHRTRLFMDDRTGKPILGNVPPGTVVDTTIVHPRAFDFYLFSHCGSLGTSRPIHYHVLWDENGFSSDDLQKLIFDMCFTFARCTKSISLVPPIYYAHLVAYRGRMYQEVAMEKYHFMSENVSFEQRFYKLKPGLENTMFFV